MEIRLMTSCDYDAVRTLWDGTTGIGLNSMDDSREGIEKYLRRNPSTSFVAQENGELLGVIMCGHDGRRGMIYHMTVNLQYRHSGIGKQLVDAALNALRAEGITKVMLVVMKTNETGNSFWDALGFTERKDLIYRNLSLID